VILGDGRTPLATSREIVPVVGWLAGVHAAEENPNNNLRRDERQSIGDLEDRSLVVTNDDALTKIDGDDNRITSRSNNNVREDGREGSTAATAGGGGGGGMSHTGLVAKFDDELQRAFPAKEESSVVSSGRSFNDTAHDDKTGEIKVELVARAGASVLNEDYEMIEEDDDSTADFDVGAPAAGDEIINSTLEEEKPAVLHPPPPASIQIEKTVVVDHHHSAKTTNTTKSSSSSSSSTSSSLPKLVDSHDNVYILSSAKTSIAMQLSDDPQFFQDITILLVLATTLGALANQLGIPSILGYLLAGALVGPGGFGAINEVVQVQTTSQIGVLLIMFSLGLEFDVKATMESNLRNVSIFGSLLSIAVLTCIISVGLWITGGVIIQGLFIGLVVSMSSTSVAIKCLEAQPRGLSSTAARVSVGVLIVQDFCVGLIFAFLPFMKTAAAEYKRRKAAATSVADATTTTMSNSEAAIITTLFMVIVKLAAFLLLAVALARLIVPKLFVSRSYAEERRLRRRMQTATPPTTPQPDTTATTTTTNTNNNNNNKQHAAVNRRTSSSSQHAVSFDEELASSATATAAATTTAAVATTFCSSLSPQPKVGWGRTPRRSPGGLFEAAVVTPRDGDLSNGNILEEETIDELKHLIALSLCFGLSLLSFQLGLSSEMGAFVAGLCLNGALESHDELKEVLHMRIVMLRDFFATLFIGTIGMFINARFLAHSFRLFVGTAASILLLKFTVMSLVVRAFGLTTRESASVGLTLCQVSEFAFILLAAGKPILGRSYYLLLLGVTPLTLIFTPISLFAASACCRRGRLPVERACEMQMR